MKKEPKKILVVTLSNLGDVVLTLPVFQSLHEHYPKAVIDVIVGPGGADVFKNDSRIHRVTVYNKRMPFGEKLNFLLSIRKEHYDLIVDLRYSLIGLLGGAKQRNRYFGYKKKFKHRVLRHLLSMATITGDTVPKNGFLVPSRADDLGDLGDSRVVVAAAGSKSDTKKWPAEYFAKLLDRLAQRYEARIVLIGDARDAEDSARVKSLMKAPVMDKCGKTDFKGLVSIASRASLVITNDSAPLHIADALGVPVLAFFGPTDPKKYGPRQSASRALTKTLFCSPCEEAQCRYKHECLKDLSVDDAFVAASRMLEDNSRPVDCRILIVRLDRIGDAVLSLPAIEAVRGRFPNAHISVLTRPYTAEVFQGHPAIDEVIAYEYKKGERHEFPFGYVRLIKGIVNRHFDMAFVLRPSVRAHLIPFLAGIPYRVGLNKSLPFLLTHKADDKRNLGQRHESEYALDVVKALGVEPVAAWPRIETFAEHDEKVSSLLGPRVSSRWVAFHAGASCASKRWPIVRFTEVARLILKNFPEYSVAIVGGPEEKQNGELFKKALGDAALDLTGRLSIKESAAFFKRCDALVTNDSGPSHIAAASGAKVLSIFGRKDPGLGIKRWRPLGEGHISIHKDAGCAVCLAHACTIDFECLKAVSVEEVFESLQSQLAALATA